MLRTQTRERGTVKIKKPGKMRWIYTAPETKEFVSDGTKIYSYIPAGPAGDGQPTCRRTATPRTPALFLAGKGDIARDFTAALAESPVRGHHRPEADAAAARGQRTTTSSWPPTQPGLQIRALATRDRQGGDSDPDVHRT